LAREGLDVTGLDISKPMLDRARRKAEEASVAVRWVEADCRQFEIDRRYRLIIFPYNSIAHLHDHESIEGCLSCIRAHLDVEGRAIIDIFNPRLENLARDPSGRFPVAEYTDPDGLGTVVITESNVYDKASQVNRIKWYYRTGDDPIEAVRELNMRIFYPQELDGLLRLNGFEIEHKYGDCDRSRFSSSSPRQIVVMRPRRDVSGPVR
jgi:SAM-dependent methyltransferase